MSQSADEGASERVGESEIERLGRHPRPGGETIVPRHVPSDVPLALHCTCTALSSIQRGRGMPLQSHCSWLVQSRSDTGLDLRPTCVGRRCSLEWPYPHLYFGIPISIYIFTVESPSVPAASPRGPQVPPLLNSLTSGGHTLRADPHSRKRVIKSHLSPPLAPFGAHEAPISRYLLVVEARILKWRKWRRWVIT